MAVDLHGRESLLPSQFFTEDDFISEKKHINKGGSSGACFAWDVPNRVASCGSSLIEMESDEDDCIAKLTRRLAQSQYLLEEDDPDVGSENPKVVSSDSICALLDSCEVLIFVVFAVMGFHRLASVDSLVSLGPESWNPKRNTGVSGNGHKRKRGHLGFVLRRCRNQRRWTQISPFSKTSGHIPKVQFNQSREEPQCWILQ